MNDSGNEDLASLAGALARLERRQEEILRRLERLEAARGTAPHEAALRGDQPRQGMPDDASCEAAPHDAALRGGRPPESVPGETAPYEAAGGGASPHQAPARVDRPPEGMPDDAARETAPGGPGPHEAVPRWAVPDEAAAQEAASGGFETRMGLTWVNRVGVVTLLLGAAFFFKYAIDSGWIGPWVRVLIGAAVGLGALAMGEHTRRGGQHIYAQGIAAAGIGILYLTVWAAFALYRLVAQGPAFLLMVLVTGAAVALALRYGSAALAALGLAGGYATPLLLASGDRPWFVLGYVLLLDLGVVYLVRERGWRSLEPLAAVGSVWVWSAQAPSPMPADRRAVFTGFALAYWGLAAGFAATWLAAAAQILMALALAGVWSAAAVPYFVLSMAVAAAGLAATGRRGWPLVPQAACWLSYWVWTSQGTHPALPSFWFLTAVFVLFLAWVPWRVWGQRAAARPQDLVLLAANAGLYFAHVYVLLGPDYMAWRGLLAVLIASTHMALAWGLWQRDGRAALLAAGVAWALLVLAAPVQFAGYRVTVVWALEGAALAWIGARLRQERATTAALAVFALVLIRLLFIDSGAYASPAGYAALANARFLTFAVAAACLWGAARWTGSGAPAAVFYVAGHFTALWGLGLEALGWAGRTAAAPNLHSAESMSVSILMAAYALLLAGLGVSTGTVLNRALGLGLIGIVVLKLYLYDVWFLALFYRMAAFAVLGALLLAMSYLYSRRRVSIENWWRGRRAG